METCCVFLIHKVNFVFILIKTNIHIYMELIVCAILRLWIILFPTSVYSTASFNTLRYFFIYRVMSISEYLLVYKTDVFVQSKWKWDFLELLCPILKLLVRCFVCMRTWSEESKCNMLCVSMCTYVEMSTISLQCILVSFAVFIIIIYLLLYLLSYALLKSFHGVVI